MNLKGVGKETPSTTNEAGGKQSDIPFRLDLLDGPAILALSEVLAHGANKYGDNNWRKIDSSSHLNHVLMHIFAILAKDEQDDHFENAFCRMMMALAMKIKEGEKPTDGLPVYPGCPTEGHEDEVMWGKGLPEERS